MVSLGMKEFFVILQADLKYLSAFLWINPGLIFCFTFLLPLYNNIRMDLFASADGVHNFALDQKAKSIPNAQNWFILRKNEKRSAKA